MDIPTTPKPPTQSLSKITWLKPGLIGFIIGIILMGIIWCIFRSKKKDTFKAHVVNNPEPKVKSILKGSKNDPIRGSKNNPMLKKSVSWDNDFVPSAKFQGNKPGYAFKKGDKGQGYYRDG